MNSITNSSNQRGFTLIEMLVVAPIVILAIGAFITVIIQLTGQVMSSRGSNIIAYNLQDALNRIEQDVKLSAGFLSKNNIAFSASNPQGQGAVNSTTDFTVTSVSNGPALILNTYVTDGNPISLNTRLIYLKGLPNDCSSYQTYSKNRPMTMNIVYFIDSAGTLWRRTVMPLNYTDTSIYCGSNAPWQRPSCIDDPARNAFCKTNDEKLLENVGTSGITINYYTSASAGSPMTVDGTTTDADLQSATTISVSLTSSDNIAGQDVSRSGTLRVSRLDTNASAVGDLHLATTAPAVPVVSGVVSDGHKVTFTWPQVPTATSYDLDYRVNGGSWQTGLTDTSNSTRTYTVTSGGHADTVEARVRASNSIGDSAYGNESIVIPIWAPMLLLNSWSFYGGNYAHPAYTKTSEGVVMLKGLIKGGSSGIAYIPAEYAPAGNLLFENATSGGGLGRIDISSGGYIVFNTGNNGYISLDSMNYISSEKTMTSATLNNSWVNYGTPYMDASYYQDSLGRVHTQGLIKSGTYTSGTVMVTLPASFAPGAWLYYPNVNSGAVRYLNINSSGQLTATGGSNSYVGINTMFYPSSQRSTGSPCTSNWCNLSLQNGWVAYGAGYGTPQYTKTDDGIVMVKGLIKSGGTTSTIATLPQYYCPSERLIMMTISASLSARVDVIPDSNPSNGCTITPVTASATYTALDSIIFRAEQ